MNKGYFTKGQIPWNKNLKGLHLHKKTEFKKGNCPSNFTGVGIPRLRYHKRDGVQVVVTIADTRISTARSKKYRTKRITSYARYMYGLDRIPPGHVIYFKDGDVFNITPSNLICISRAELLKLNRCTPTKIKLLLRPQM